MRAMALRDSGGHFTLAFVVTAVGLAGAALYGYWVFGTFNGIVSTLLLTAILAVLEVSLSFDNAVVNAHKLKDMSPLWQRRFLTWGILIAVFGMRVFFPLVVVTIAAQTGPIDALRLAILNPAQYAHIMHEAHLGIAAFGGTFLMMVSFSYFFDEAKEAHWLQGLESRMSRFAAIRGIEIALVLIVIQLFCLPMDDDKAGTFVTAANFGLVSFLIIDVVSGALDSSGKALKGVARNGLGAFLYLEVLDSSFSFDGVIGAFALTQSLVIIAIGLGIGAMYVRSMTVMLVERGTLTRFCYLEHGAFYSVFTLSVVMYLQSLIVIPELITGLIAAAIIGLSLWASKRSQIHDCD